MSIDRLTLDFSSFAYWDVSQALACRSKLVILLEAALVKGCRRLDLRGDLPGFAFSPDPRIFIPRTPKGSHKQHRRRCTRWFHSYPSQKTPPLPPAPPFVLFPKPKIPAPSTAWQSRLSFMTGPPSLTELEMESSLMLTPSLLSHTFSLLQTQSPVLRKLKIRHSGAFYEEFFSTISLPVLESFTYMTKYGSPRLFELLFMFLIRHPDIQKVKFPPIRMYSDVEYPTFDTKTFLPNLRAIYAHPNIISWLLQDPNAFLNLERVSIEAKNNYTFRSYDDIDVALVVLGSRMNDSLSCCEGPTHLKFNFSADEDFCLWLLSHITNPCASPIQHLKKVETLLMSLYDSCATLEVHHLDNLIAWASLFPNLKWMRVNGYFDDELCAAVRTERFVNTLKDMCPMLERCSVNGWDWVK
jgi:hypothetical protein